MSSTAGSRPACCWKMLWQLYSPAQSPQLHSSLAGSGATGHPQSPTSQAEPAPSLKIERILDIVVDSDDRPLLVARSVGGVQGGDGLFPSRRDVASGARGVGQWSSIQQLAGFTRLPFKAKPNEYRMERAVECQSERLQLLLKKYIRPTVILHMQSP